MLTMKDRGLEIGLTETTQRFAEEDQFFGVGEIEPSALSLNEIGVKHRLAVADLARQHNVDIKAPMVVGAHGQINIEAIAEVDPDFARVVERWYLKSQGVDLDELEMSVGESQSASRLANVLNGVNTKHWAKRTEQAKAKVVRGGGPTSHSKAKEVRRGHKRHSS